jgi:hypothetical protein
MTAALPHWNVTASGAKALLLAAFYAGAEAPPFHILHLRDDASQLQ